MSSSPPAATADRALTVSNPVDHTRQQAGELETSLRAGKRALLLEAKPPEGPDLASLLDAARRVGDDVDAIQLTDMPFATPHVANLAAAAALRQAGHEVVINLSCRDRNTIAQQGTLLGAAALGIRNVFCIRGDDPSVGDHPQARGVFETSGLELIRLAKGLRENSAYLSGRRFSPAPALFIGAAIAPHAGYGEGARTLAKRKVDAGADFLVTQPLCDVDTLPDFFAQAGSAIENCFVFAGVGPITSLDMLRALSASDEVFVSEELAEALQGASSDAQRLQRGMDQALRIVHGALTSGARGVLVYPFDCHLEETRSFCQAVRALLQA